MFADESPLTEVLSDLEISTAEAALLGGCSQTAVSAAKAGTGAVPKGLLLKLAETAGVDVPDLCARQDAWRAERGRQIASRLRSGSGGQIPGLDKQAAGVSFK